MNALIDKECLFKNQELIKLINVEATIFSEISFPLYFIPLINKAKLQLCYIFYPPLFLLYSTLFHYGVGLKSSTATGLYWIWDCRPSSINTRQWQPLVSSVHQSRVSTTVLNIYGCRNHSLLIILHLIWKSILCEVALTFIKWDEKCLRSLSRAEQSIYVTSMSPMVTYI